MNYGRYNRSVMILSEQGREFAGGEGRVTGYLKVETGNNKGAMRCSVENLRPWPKGDYIYKLILFGNRGERMTHAVIGTVPVGRSGSGEAYFRFNPLDVDGKGNDYASFSAAVVASVSMRDDGEPLHPVLKGNTGNESEEAPRPLAASISEKRDEDVEPAAEEPVQEVKPAARPAAGSEKNSAAGPTMDSVKNLGAGPTMDSVKDSAARPAAGSEKNSAAGARCYNDFYNEYILHACAHTCQVAEYYEEVRPFVEDRTGARWKKIMNIMNLPLVSPGAHYFASLYHHYLFGARPDERGYASCYFFGIPGRRMEAEQPDGGRSGFVYWQPMKGTESQKNPYGYWIVEIDGQTGDIHNVTIEKNRQM